MARWTHLVRTALHRLTRRPATTGPRAGTRSPGPAGPTATRTTPGSPARTALPDHVGPVRTRYSPSPDGRPDPGEIVWTWVAYEDDPSRGKDRPVLLVGRDGPVLLALPLTSKDHDTDAADEARHGRAWVDIGTGGWDSRRRPSEVRLDRVLRIDPATVRREGAVLPRDTFLRVTDSLARHHGW
ncbi:type II toxin-antitoxin system PemK/MazF family toxin [Cellulomonas soli]|uniref:type II toxin-antitoxin system PemK/MazF family toxin n=1 Tax=Cellulomonas soli TaxID=931535 RepID=UPI003F877287